MLNTFFERSVNFAQCFSIVRGQGFDNKCGAQLNAQLSHVIGIGNIINFKTFVAEEEKEDSSNMNKFGIHLIEKSQTIFKSSWNPTKHMNASINYTSKLTKPCSLNSKLTYLPSFFQI